MSASLIQSWITVFVAAFPAFHVGKVAWITWKARMLDGDEEQERSLFTSLLGRGYQHWETKDGPIRPSPFVSRATELLNPLCDLQLVTGLGIMVAGFAKWKRISFYHEALISCYWSLTLNSFWAARIAYMDYDTTEDNVRVILRQTLVLISCLLGGMWQLLTWLREQTVDQYPGGQWKDRKDLCYRYLDGSSPLIWLIGIFVFCIALGISLLGRTNAFQKTFVQKTFDKQLEKVQKSADNWYQQSRKRDKSVRRLVEVTAAFASRITWWVFTQWIGVWSFGDGFLPLTWVFYLLFDVWNTVDVISLWALNRPLLEAEERQWGFGQVLPLVMLLSIIFSGVDIWRGKTAFSFRLVYGHLVGIAMLKNEQKSNLDRGAHSQNG